MAGLSRALVPPRGARAVFGVAGVAMFATLSTGLVLLPRGGGEGATVRGEEVRAELVDGVGVTLVGELRDRGWRADWPSEPYALDLELTIENESDEPVTRRYDVRVTEVSDPGDPFILRQSLEYSLGTAHVPAGTSLTTGFGFHHTDGCGDFIAFVDYSPDSDYGSDLRTVEVPFTIGDEECLADLA
ncbi:hypothetical protein [Georgenia sp. Z1491]|uniref:hypothetical protein n=1 Tax=Georgenia sp. Z1491 TaxID=3416707 RepID=UPI003CE88B5D